MIRTLICLALGLFLLTAVGCEAPSRTYDISVTNRLSVPLTVWLTKGKPPYEEGWYPPEDVAQMSRATDHLEGAQILQPGQTQDAKVTGHIDDSNVAVLRVYRATEINTILAIDPTSVNRVDVPLDPGRDDYDITEAAGRLIYVPHGSAPPSN